MFLDPVFYELVEYWISFCITYQTFRLNLCYKNHFALSLSVRNF
jgi:hypothetical protein